MVVEYTESCLVVIKLLFEKTKDSKEVSHLPAEND